MFALLILLSILHLFEAAYVGLKLYGWFIIGHIPGIPSLSYKDVLSVLLFIGFWRMIRTSSSKRTEISDKAMLDGVIVMSSHVLLLTPAALLLGWLAHLVMNGAPFP